MISAFGYILGASAPLFLAGAPIALGLLIYVYRRNGTTREAIVSSVYLLKNLPRRLPARRRFIPPLQFWIELLIFLCLALAAAGVFVEHTGKHVAIVVDTSMSMAALDQTRATLLDAATSSALTDISSASSDTIYDLFTVDDQLTPLGAGKLLREDARKLLTQVKPGPTIDRLGTLVIPLLSDPQYDGVWIYTDHPLGDTAPQPNIKHVSVFTPSKARELTNAWISDVRVREKDGSAYVSVTAQVVSPETRRITVGASCTDSGRSRTFEVPSRALTVQPHSAGQVELGPIDGAWDYCQVSTSLAGERVSDALSLDDKAWIAHDKTASQVYLVSELAVSDLGLDQLTGITITKGASSVPPEAPALFHRALPSSDRRAPTLVIFPPSGTLPWGGSVTESAAQNTPVTRWSESHPILQYVNVPLISLPAMRKLDCPPSAIPILYAPEGAIACAGTSAATRYAIVGFELLPFDGIKSPSLSILLLNLVKWLFQGSGPSLADQFIGGVIAAPSGAASAKMLNAPAGPLEIGSDDSVHPRAPGIIEFRTSTGSVAGYRAYNAFSNEESDVSIASDITLPAMERASTSQRDETKIPMYRWFALVAAVFLLLDLLRRFLVKASWSSR